MEKVHIKIQIMDYNFQGNFLYRNRIQNFCPPARSANKISACKTTSFSESQFLQ